MEKKNKLAEEIYGKLPRLTLSNIELSNGMHISAYHVGLSDEELKRRQKLDRKEAVSSFTDANTVDLCLYEMFSDKYFVEKELSAFLADNSVVEKEFEYFSFNNETVGRFVVANGGVMDVHSFRIVLTKNLDADRDLNTGMPFTVITMYPIED